MIVGALCQPIQEVVIALAEQHDALRVLRRFSLGVGLAGTGILAALALTPLADAYFGAFIGLPPTLRAFTQTAAGLMVAYPLLMSLELMLRGVLIRQHRTAAVRLAMGCFVLTLGLALAAGAALNLSTGVQQAALAINLAIVVEIAALAWQAVPVVHQMRQAVAA